MSGPGKTAIVTGASQGIGAGIVKAFVERGFNVVANSRKMTRSAEVAASYQVALVDGHIGEPATATRIVETALSRFKSIDVLVNNAGIFFTKPFTDYTGEDFKTLVSTNVEGFLHITQRVIKQMLRKEPAGALSRLQRQAWMQKTQPRLLVLWGKYDLSFDLSEPEAYRRDVPKAQVHVLDAGHFALDTAADEIADLVRRFMAY